MFPYTCINLNISTNGQNLKNLTKVKYIKYNYKLNKNIRFCYYFIN